MHCEHRLLRFSRRGRRTACRHLAAAIMIALLPIVGAQAQDAYPSRPIKLIVPFAAGGNTDAIGRVTASYMEQALKVSVVVENRPGAGGIVGTDAVAESGAGRLHFMRLRRGPLTVDALDRKGAL